MRYKEIGGSLFSLELLHKVEHLSADGNVQRRDRLVRNDKLRLHYHGAGKTYTLSLSAGELVGVSCKMLGKKAYFVHDLFDLADSVGFVFVKVEVIKSLGDDIVYGRALVKRRRGILEDLSLIHI